MDIAPGWQIRCKICGMTKPLNEMGWVRLGAASKGKRTLAWCRPCNRFRCVVVEKVDPK